MLPLVYMKNSDCVQACYSQSASSRAVNDLIKTLDKSKCTWNEHINHFANSIYENLSKAESGNIEYFIDKTPRYHLIINELSAIFPDAKFIILTRNPLSCLASGIDTWGKGKLKIHGQMIDLVEGPKNIANAITDLGDRAYKIKYEDIVKSPEDSLAGIYKFLDLSYDENILEKQSTLPGTMGDPNVSDKYKITTDGTQKYLYTLGTYYRKRFAKKYIQKFSQNDLEAIGYPLEDILNDIHTLPSSMRWIFDDIITHFFATLWRVLDLGYIRKKMRIYKSSRHFYIHN